MVLGGKALAARARPGPTTRTRARVATPTRALFGFGGRDEEKEREKEEQMRAQQEVLKRRKSNSWQAGVKDRRAKASRYLNDPEFKKVCDEENRKKFKERQAMEEPEPTSGFRIIVPITPFGMPEYDGGERFDLRLPYVDNGWVDEDADPMKQFRRFIGLVRMTTMTTMTTKMISLSLSLALRALPVCPFITRRTRRPSRTTATAPRGERGRERNE
jgi:hypothetical protein